MKKITSLLFIFVSSLLFAQKDSLQLGDRYLEDQIYFGISYNQFFNQPATVIGSGFSYGINTGYIKDISLNKSGRFALGIGIGYSYDSFNHGFKLSSKNNEVLVEIDPTTSSKNNFTMHAIEFPFEIRWRTSNANKYKFWRIYTGIKLSYNLKNKFEYATATDLVSYSNIDRFNKVQYGLTISAGYSAFNFNFYYGLSPILKEASIGTNNINTKILRMGILFYFL